MRSVTVAAVQMAYGIDTIGNAERLVRSAAEKGAQIILLQELFETPYFCQKEKPAFYDYAKTLESNPAVIHFSKLAKILEVVIPISFYERAGNALYNSIAVIDADGTVVGVYRKSHIPDGPGYEEKYYFNPGDTGFRVWKTRYATIGVGICWDQWFPEPARIMALMGAELLFYPTAIGSEPESPDIDSMPHWRRCMVGHAACNLMPVIAANRIGTETIEDSSITFYGSSFITDATGALVAEADRSTETVLLHTFDLEALAAQRTEWGLFRDRRPELYGAILTNDGKNRVL